MEKQIEALYESYPALPYEGHTGQLDNVLSSLENGTTPAITGIDGRRTIEIITAIYKAGSTHTCVKLPISKDDAFYTVDGIRASVPHFYEKTTSAEINDIAITVESEYKKKA